MCVSCEFFLPSPSSTPWRESHIFRFPFIVREGDSIPIFSLSSSVGKECRHTYEITTRKYAEFEIKIRECLAKILFRLEFFLISFAYASLNTFWDFVFRAQRCSKINKMWLGMFCHTCDKNMKKKLNIHWLDSINFCLTKLKYPVDCSNSAGSRWKKKSAYHHQKYTIKIDKRNNFVFL